MSNEKPDALRLADVLEKEHLHTITVDMDAAKELRRLHEENEKLRIAYWKMREAAAGYSGYYEEAEALYQAAITKVEGKT